MFQNLKSDRNKQNMLKEDSKILILGLYVIDAIIKNTDKNINVISEKNRAFSLGGPPTYMGFVGNILSDLFSEVNKPSLYTYICPKVELFLESTSDIFNLSGHFINYPKCPEFRLDYSQSGQEREITLFNPLARFDTKLFPWKLDECTITIVNSVYQEFNNPDIFSFLRKNQFFIVLDPQGFFRKISPNGKVVYSNWFNRSILSQVDCLKLSEHEAGLLEIGNTLSDITLNLLNLNISYVIITKGQNGAILGCKDPRKSLISIFSIPAYKVDTSIDETGAGDAFLYAFIVFLQLSADKLEAIAFATSIASLLVENRFDVSKYTIDSITNRQEFIKTQIKELDIESLNNLDS